MIIYKYLNEEGALKTIENNSVILKTPIEYNDPFDSIFHVSKKEIKESYRLYMDYKVFEEGYKQLIVNKKKPSTLGLITKKNIELEIPIIRKTYRFRRQRYLTISYKYGLMITNQKDSDYQKQFNDVMSVVMKSLRSIALVSCFGSSHDSILMWSHYADKHRGACIEFEVDDANFKKVSYSPKLIDFKLSKALEIILGHDFIGAEVDTGKPEYQFLLEPIFTKSSIWEYEGEVRCVFSKTNTNSDIETISEDGEDKILLKMPKIKAIYLGCNSSDAFIEQVEKKCKNIPIYKMKMLENEYGLTCETICEK